MEQANTFSALVAKDLSRIDLVAIEREARVLRARAVAEAVSSMIRSLRGMIFGLPRAPRAA